MPFTLLAVLSFAGLLIAVGWATDKVLRDYADRWAHQVGDQPSEDRGRPPPQADFARTRLTGDSSPARPHRRPDAACGNQGLSVVTRSVPGHG